MEITGQVLAFVMTIMTGILLGVLFDFYRVLRGTFNPKVMITWFADLLYWLLATGIVFTALIFSNWGELRFYVFFGILSGLGLYYNWLSLYAIRLLAAIIKLIIAGLSLLKNFFIGVFIRPVVYCIRMVSWPFMIVGRTIKVWHNARYPKPPNDEK